MGAFGRFQLWCAINKLHQLWGVEYDIVEEGYKEKVEFGGIDAGDEILQIFADPLEPKMCENGEDRAC